MAGATWNCSCLGAILEADCECNGQKFTGERVGEGKWGTVVLFCVFIAPVHCKAVTCVRLCTLHWLPVTHRIQYKISTICFNSISGTAPQYLSDLLQPYTRARQLGSTSDTRTFVTPCVNTKTFGERSFCYAGPSVWNNLPQTLRHSDSTSSFKAALKTHLFNNYF